VSIGTSRATRKKPLQWGFFFLLTDGVIVNWRSLTDMVGWQPMDAGTVAVLRDGELLGMYYN